MKLDPRIKIRPLDCFDTDIAKQFIGKTVYCTDIASYFTDLKYCRKGKLLSIDEDAEYVYGVLANGLDGLFLYILPVEWTKKENDN